MPDDDSELLDVLRAAAASRRGYADFDSWPDQDVRDLGIGADFAKALHRHCGSSLHDLRNSPKGFDPPDLLAGDDIGVELTELVDQTLVEQAVADKRAGVTPGRYRDWTSDQLRASLYERIAVKDSATPKAVKPLRHYWLVIHTDEPGLSPELVASYLRPWTPPSCVLITRAFLLMSYFPSHAGRPLYELIVRRAA